MTGGRPWTMILAAAAVWLAAPPNGSAQAGEPSVAFRAAVEAGYEHFTASRTFQAIFGTPNGPTLGFGVDVLVPHHIFVRVGAAQFHRSGERAFDLNGQVFRLGIPLDVTIKPITVSAGYRTFLTPRIAWYAGGGAGSWSYTESSSGADATENTKGRFKGYLVLAGSEVRVHRWIGVGFEAEYAAVPHALGTGGVSADFKESNLGGTSARLRLIIGR